MIQHMCMAYTCIVDSYKPVNIEITATFPELGCHFHSVFRREEPRLTMILENVMKNTLTQ